MAKLIVEFGGTTRRFKLGDGKLTLGSGPAATLTIDSPDLAEVHAEIEISGGSVVLRSCKGTMPPSVRGVSVKGDVKLAAGVKVALGDVTLSLEGAAPEGKGPAKGPAPAPRRQAAPAVKPRSSGGSARVQRTRPVVHSQSLPSGLIVVIILAVAGVGFLLVRSAAEGLDDEAFSPVASETRIQEKLAEADFRSARKEIDKIQRHWKELDPTWHSKFKRFEKDVEAAEEEARLLARNSEGDVYFQKQLENFIDNYLDLPNRPAARILLKRISWFEKEYPRHPQLAWCKRMKERWRATAAPSEAATYEDLAFEVKTMTWAMPRDYKTAFRLIDNFVTGSAGSDRAMAEALREEHEGTRREYFEDRMLQAKYEYGHDSGEQKSSAVRWLTELITKIGDDDMANKAADVMVKIPGIEGPLRGYYNSERHTYDALVENAIVRGYIEANDVLAGL